MMRRVKRRCRLSYLELSHLETLHGGAATYQLLSKGAGDGSSRANSDTVAIGDSNGAWGGSATDSRRADNVTSSPQSPDVALAINLGFMRNRVMAADKIVRNGTTGEHVDKGPHGLLVVSVRDDRFGVCKCMVPEAWRQCLVSRSASFVPS